MVMKTKQDDDFENEVLGVQRQKQATVVAAVRMHVPGTSVPVEVGQRVTLTAKDARYMISKGRAIDPDGPDAERKIEVAKSRRKAIDDNNARLGASLSAPRVPVEQIAEVAGAAAAKAVAAAK